MFLPLHSDDTVFSTEKSIFKNQIVMLELHSVTSDFPRQFYLHLCPVNDRENLTAISVKLHCIQYLISSLVHQIEAFSCHTDFEISRKKFCWVIVAKMAFDRIEAHSCVEARRKRKQ